MEPCLGRMGVDLLVNAKFDTVLLRDDSSQVKVPVLAMRGGSDLQTYVDILVPSNAKLTLVRVSFISYAFETVWLTFNLIFDRAKAPST